MLSRGDPTNRHLPRDSLLERFDPLSARKSIAPQQLSKKISPIVENNSISEELISGLNEINSIEENNQCLIKLDSTEKTDIVQQQSQQQLRSESPSISESYVTASLGDPKSRVVCLYQFTHFLFLFLIGRQ